MNRLAPRFSMTHLAGLALAPWAACACNGRLSVSEDSSACPGRNCAPPPVASAPFFTDPSPLPSSSSDTDDDIPTPVASSCEDGIRNGEEGDIDCGGACTPCASGSSCQRHGDCESGLCRAGVCTRDSCEDGVQNGSETGVDCGGECDRCRSTSCDCGQSAALSALSCDERPGFRVERSDAPFVTYDGRTALYGACYRLSSFSQSSCETYRWSQAAGLELLAASDSTPRGLSDDGQTMLYQVGTRTLLQRVNSPALEVPLQGSVVLAPNGGEVIGSVNDVYGGWSLARWTPLDGVQTLAQLEGAFPVEVLGVEVSDLIGDASVIVGAALYSDGKLPFRWNVADGVQVLEVPGGPGISGGRPIAVSRDGAVVVGVATDALDRIFSAFRWTQSEGLQLILGDASPLPPLFINLDGSVLAGTSYAPAPNSTMIPRAVRSGFPWEAAVLFSEPSTVTDMNGDGSVVVGTATQARRPVLWTVGSGVFDLIDLTAARGVDTIGWQLREPSYVAENGSFVFGRGLCGEVDVTYRLAL